MSGRILLNPARNLVFLFFPPQNIRYFEKILNTVGKTRKMKVGTDGNGNMVYYTHYEPFVVQWFFDLMPTEVIPFVQFDMPESGPIGIDYKLDTASRRSGEEFSEILRSLKSELGDIDVVHDFVDKLFAGELTPFHLMDHQKIAISEGTFRSNYGIFFEMRLGKTITALSITYIYYLLFGIRNVVVTCPISSVEAWLKESSRFKVPMNVYPLSFVTNSKFDKMLEELEDNLTVGPNLVILHYEFLRTKKAEDFYTVWNKVTNSIGGYVLIVDEIHKAKNTNTLTHKKTYELARNARKVLGLTGTPFGSTVEDLFGVTKVLRTNHLIGAPNLGRFRELYMFRIPNANFYKPLKDSYDILTNKISSFSIAAKQSDVFKEAKINMEELHYEMTREQRKYYESIRDGIITELEEGRITVNNALTESIKLLQVLSGFVLVPKEDSGEITIKEFYTPKDDLLLDILDTYENEQAIVWVLFDYEDKKLTEFLRRYKISVRSISGDTPKSQRISILEDFRKGLFKVLVSKPQILGAGVDLSNAKISIFYSRNYDFINRDQALSRQLNLTKPGIYTVIDLICSRTIDERVLDNLKLKKSITDEIKDKSSFMRFLK